MLSLGNRGARCENRRCKSGGLKIRNMKRFQAQGQASMNWAQVPQAYSKRSARQWSVRHKDAASLQGKNSQSSIRGLMARRSEQAHNQKLLGQVCSRYECGWRGVGKLSLDGWHKREFEMYKKMPSPIKSRRRLPLELSAGPYLAHRCQETYDGSNDMAICSVSVRTNTYAVRNWPWTLHCMVIR